jgi:uncharacterized membrane protein
MFDVTGSFGNPGQLGGYLAVCLVITLSLFVVNFREKNKTLSILLLAGSLLQGVGLYLSDSRAGWVGLLVGVVVLFKHRDTETRRFFFKKLCVSVSLCLITAVAIAFLYSYRPKSADARLLIWRVSCDMIAERPLLGHGAGAFYDKYMFYQAAFFEKHPESRFAIVADNAGNPFNELLNTVISFGVVGAVLLLFLLWTAFGVRGTRIFADNASAQAGLAAWLAFSMFSYPAGVFPLLLLAITCLGGIESDVKWSFSISRWFYGTAILLITIVLFPVWQHTAKLKRLSAAFGSMNLHEHIDEVENSYSRMKFNPTFNGYYMLWMERQPVEQYTDRVKEASPSCEGYYMMGNYYLKTGDTEQAERAFRTASNMVPTRIRPKYALWKLYVEKGDMAAARQMAQTILDNPLKIESVYTLRVKKEMRVMLEAEQ